MAVYNIAMTDMPPPSPRQEETLTVAVPALPGGVVRMKRFYSDAFAEVVLADPRKMAKAWADDIREEFRRAHPLKAAFGGKSDNRELALYETSPLEKSIGHMQMLAGKDYAVALEMPQVSYYKGRFGYQNGIHRTFNLAKLGATAIPVELTKGSDVEGFKRRFGAGVTAAPPLRPSRPGSDKFNGSSARAGWGRASS